MIEPHLQSRVAPLARMVRAARILRLLAIGWAVAAAVGGVIVLTDILAGKVFTQPLWIAPLAVGVVGMIVILSRQRQIPGDYTEVIRKIDPEQPDTRHLLSAALEQRPSHNSGEFSFLQLRVIREALLHPRQSLWHQRLRRSLAAAFFVHACALIGFLGVLFLLVPGANGSRSVIASMIGEEITISPGDTEIERGTGLVVAARFGGTPPADATLVVNYSSGKESRFPMARRLADPIFGASVPEISEAGHYHIEYRGKKTQEYKIGIFEYPALTRADAALRYPSYTGLSNKTILDTLRVSAVEGSHLTYTLHLNKGVTRARLAGTNGSLTLDLRSNAVAVLPDLILTNSARYSLELLDADGRSNKFPTEIVFLALTNERPEVKLVFPRGDPRVSKLQELQVEAKASDDFGLLRYGIGFGIAGDEPKLVELGQATPANTVRDFNYLISLESLDVDVDQTVAYFAWADDYGPDGQPRRTYSDMFFADVRPFDEIFRADQSGGGGGGGGQNSGGDARVKLAQLQKQIIAATWNIQREHGGAIGGPHP